MADSLHINSLSLDDDLFRSLDKVLAQAVQYADKNPVKRKPSKRSGGIPQEQLDMLLESGDQAYLNEEWTDAVKIYMDLLESGADLPPFVDARLALCYACLGEWEPSIEHATKSYENNPAEAAAYVAMAKCTVLSVSMPDSGLRWLQLASKAVNIPDRIFKETKSELEEVLILNEQEERYAIPFLQQPNVFERVAMNPEFTSLVDMEELQVAIETVTADPSLLKETRGRSPSLSAMLKILYNDPDVLLPRTYPPQEITKMMQKSPLHQIGETLFQKITAYLPLPSIAAVQNTSQLCHLWANQPELWREVYSRSWEPLQQSTFGVPLLPYMWKYNFKTRHGLLTSTKAVFETIMHQRADPSDIEAMRKRALTNVARVYRSSSAPSAVGTMSNQFIEAIDLLATSATPLNALYLFDSPAFLTVAVTSLTRVGFNSSVLECQTALLALICGANAGGPQVMKSLLLLGVKTICSNLLFGPLHSEACALFALLRLGETNFAKPVLSVMPSSFWCANFPEERLNAVTENLNGIWRHFMFYDNLDLKSIIELGASKLLFDPNDMSLHGEGSDTIGTFNIVDGSFNLRSGEISFVRQYRGVMLEFVGIAHPFGFGGSFQLAATEEDTEPPVLLGYWMSHFMYKSMTDEEWKVGVADMKSKAARRSAGKHPEPWAEVPGPTGLLSQDLRHLTRATFAISLPSASLSDIYQELEKLPQINNEDLQKYSAPALLRGLGETEEKFRLRETTHTTMMIMLFERRTEFGLRKWDEVEHDLRALEAGDVSSAAILHKWHDYLCLYTFDNYSISSGVDGLCQFFRLILSMAQDIRSRGGDPALFGVDPHAEASSSGAGATTSSLDTDLDRLPSHFAADSDVESIQADEEGTLLSEDNNSRSAFTHHPRIEEEDMSDEEDEEDEEEDAEDEEQSSTVSKQRTKRARGTGISASTVVVAAGVVAAISAGVFALTRYLVRPKGNKN